MSSETKFIHEDTWFARSQGQRQSDLTGIGDRLEQMHKMLIQADEVLRNNSMGNLGYTGESYHIDYVMEFFHQISNYTENLRNDIYNIIELPVKDYISTHVLEPLKSIDLTKITTENTIGIEETFTTRDSEGRPYVTTREKSSLTLADFMGIDGDSYDGCKNLEYIEGFSDLFKADYENYTEDYSSYEKYARSVLNSEKERQIREYISGVLDLTIVKPVIEAIIGEDLITGQKLSDYEKAMKVVGAVVDTFCLATALTSGGGSLTLKTMLKTLLAEGVTDFTAYSVGYWTSEMGMSTSDSLFLSLLVGMIMGGKMGDWASGSNKSTADLLDNVDDYADNREVRNLLENAGSADNKDVRNLFENADDYTSNKNTRELLEDSNKKNPYKIGDTDVDNFSRIDSKKPVFEAEPIEIHSYNQPVDNINLNNEYRFNPFGDNCDYQRVPAAAGEGYYYPNKANTWDAQKGNNIFYAKSNYPNSTYANSNGSSSRSCTYVRESQTAIDYVNPSGSTVRIKKQSIDDRIYSHINEPKKEGDVIEGKVAEYIKQNTNSRIIRFSTDVDGRYANENGNLWPFGDIDIETETQFFEVKTSIGQFKIEQLEKYINPSDKRYFNIDGKEVAVYIHEPIEMTSNNIKK